MMAPDIKKDRDFADKFDPSKPPDKFIREIVLTNFKNIEPGTRVTFDYPITAFVGANGTGKSSVLHALWGMPLGKSTSRFWFSTAVDPIDDGREAGLPRYWYKHWLKELKEYVETKKVRANKRLGYWEPARALASDGMKKMPPKINGDETYRSADRWTPTRRDVVYLNFKCEFSAFDRFFYFDDGRTLESKQGDYIKGALRLARVIEGKLRSYSPGGKEAVYANRELTTEELKWVSFVLGREYSGATYIRHRLLTGTESPSVLFRRHHFSYSEASAGSGELAVVRGVIRLLEANPCALVLLDEPETSLHPGAQQALISFLFHLIRTKQMQVVMSTHSPTIVDLLPTRAIRVLEETPNGKNRIVQVSHPHVAFNRLGHASSKKLAIAVEDDLLHAMVRLAMSHLDPGEKELIEIYIPPGGAESILTHDIPVWINSSHDYYAILDGDKKPKAVIPNPEEMTPIEQKSLPSMIKSIFDVKPDHIGSDLDAAKKYVDWVRVRLRFLDAICPEMVLLERLVGEDEAQRLARTNQQAKEKLVSKLKEGAHETTADALHHSVSWIIKNRGTDDPIIQGLVVILKEFISHHDASKRT